MPARVSRRAALAAIAALPLAGCAASTLPAPTPRPSDSHRPADDAAFAALEGEFGARLGLVALETATGTSIEYRADERFAFCSTYKALAAAAILLSRPIEQLEEVVEYTAADLVTYSPITERATELTLRQLCDAAVRVSDNTAGNLLLAELGGPAGFTAALRGIGDDVTRSDRLETALNEASPGDARDTSTPRALADDLRALTLDDALPVDRRMLLVEWMTGNATGDTLIRAGVPAGWTVGDKSGAGDYGSRNDIGIAYPPDADPIVFAVLSTRSEPDDEYDDALIARATEIAIGRLT